MHYLVAKGALGSNKHGFLHVGKRHLYMIITRESIYELKDQEVSGIVYQYINVGSGKSSLGLALFKSL